LAVPVDDLNAPLGQDIGKRPSATTSISWALVGGVVGVIVLAAAMAKLLLIRPTGPAVAPAVIAAPESARPERTGAIPEKSSLESAGTNIPPAAALPEADKPASPATQTITIIDGRSGKREQIVIPVTPPPNR
jgi:hypothetical protein